MSKENKTSPATPESVWEFLVKLGEKIEQSSAEFDRRIAEADKRVAEADKRAAKFTKGMQELKEAQKRTDKQIGAIANSNGRMAEQIVYNSLERKMTLADIKFNFIELNKNRHNKELNLKGDTIL